MNQLYKKHSYRIILLSTYLCNQILTNLLGYTIHYHNDYMNRLEYVKDAEGNLVSENQYNYKN